VSTGLTGFYLDVNDASENLKPYHDSRRILTVKDESLVERKTSVNLKTCKPKPQLRSEEIHLKRSSTSFKPVDSNLESRREVKSVSFLID
jgi:hypothetical protein